MSRPSTTSSGDPFRNMGRGMLWGFWLLVLASGTWFFSWREEQTPVHPNSSPEQRITEDRRELRLQADRRGHYLVDGAIDGQTVTFLLDTGASAVVVPGADARRLGLERGQRIPVRTASGQDFAWRTRIDRLVMGPLELQGVDAAIAPGLEGTVLLGMSALSQLEMTQRQGELVLAQQR